jgi:hypothetical protein
MAQDRQYLTRVIDREIFAISAERAQEIAVSRPPGAQNHLPGLVDVSGAGDRFAA